MSQEGHMPFDVESLNTSEGILSGFKEIRQFIEDFAGIKLTNIELVGLRKIVKETMNTEYKQDKDLQVGSLSGSSDFDHRIEAPARFFSEFYGIDFIEATEKRRTLGKDNFRRFLKSKQESLHLPYVD